MYSIAILEVLTLTNTQANALEISANFEYERIVHLVLPLRIRQCLFA
jgi:hypothetical protein